MTTGEDIRQRLVDSHLATSDEADAYLKQWRSQADDADSAEVFARWLVDREWLTEFQAEALLAGHSGPFLLGPYEVREHLAHGKLGGVFSAIHRELDQRVSLKVFSGSVGEDPDRLARVGWEIPAQIDETIAGMLAKSAEDRFQSADEVAFALEPFVEKAPESVCVVPVSDAYLAWAERQHSKKQDIIPSDAVGITPELTHFLGWIEKKQVRHQ